MRAMRNDEEVSPEKNLRSLARPTRRCLLRSQESQVLKDTLTGVGFSPLSSLVNSLVFDEGSEVRGKKYGARGN